LLKVTFAPQFSIVSGYTVEAARAGAASMLIIAQRPAPANILLIVLFIPDFRHDQP